APAAKRGGGLKWALVLGGGLCVVLAAAVAGFLLLGGKKAGPNPAVDRDAIREVARRFVDTNQGDESAFLALLTDKAREQMAKSKKVQRGGIKPRPGMVVHVGEPTVTGDTGQVQVTQREAGKEQKLVL